MQCFLRWICQKACASWKAPPFEGKVLDSTQPLIPPDWWSISPSFFFFKETLFWKCDLIILLQPGSMSYMQANAHVLASAFRQTTPFVNATLLGVCVCGIAIHSQFNQTFFITLIGGVGNWGQIWPVGQIWTTSWSHPGCAELSWGGEAMPCRVCGKLGGMPPGAKQPRPLAMRWQHRHQASGPLAQKGCWPLAYRNTFLTICVAPKQQTEHEGASDSTAFCWANTSVLLLKRCCERTAEWREILLCFILHLVKLKLGHFVARRWAAQCKPVLMQPGHMVL